MTNDDCIVNKNTMNPVPHPNRDAVEPGTAVELGRHRSSSAARSHTPRSQSPRLLCLSSRRCRHSRRTSVTEPPKPVKKTRHTHQPQRQDLHARIRFERNTFPINNAHAAASAAATNPLASRSLGTPPRSRPSPPTASLMLRATSVLLVRRVDGVLLL